MRTGVVEARRAALLASVSPAWCRGSALRRSRAYTSDGASARLLGLRGGSAHGQEGGKGMRNARGEAGLGDEANVVAQEEEQLLLLVGHIKFAQL